ncbi:MAG: hypothetical protein JNJ83_24160 [Verrucomicrobiaceae bacterium]|nr:hypothetical protein [Verrucomicrobiaceae bacterium]
MHSPNEPDAPTSGPFNSPFTEDEYLAWLKEDPRRAEMLVETLEKTFEEKKLSMTPEELAEAVASRTQFMKEMAYFILDRQMMPLLERFAELVQDRPSIVKKLDEVRLIEKDLVKYLDLAQHLDEPRRGADVYALQRTLELAQLLLSDLG